MTSFGIAFVPARPLVADDGPGKPPPDEYQVLVKEVERAYQASAGLDAEILSELRKQYDDPKPDRETAILRLVRRGYVTNKLIEERIVRETQAASKNPSAEQEERVFEAIRRGGALPPGTIPADEIAEHAAKMFHKFDRNGDGQLSPDEMSETLRDQLRTWDHNRDGMIDQTEYAAYFQASLKSVADGIASGAIPVKRPKNQQPAPAPAIGSPPPVTAKAAATIPAWFSRLDEDGDGQIGLYEWKKAGQPLDLFLAIDRNHDGFVETKELLAYMAEHPEWKPGR